MGEGCAEYFDVRFIQWILRYPATKRPGILKSLEELSKKKTVIILRSQSEIERFLRLIAESGRIEEFKL